MRTGRPRTRTPAEERAAETLWMQQYRERLREQKKIPKLLHPEVVNRRKQRGGRRTAQLIREGIHTLPVPGMGWKTTLKRDPNA